MPDPFCLIWHWSELIDIGHWNQCQNFDWHWALIKGVLIILLWQVVLPTNCQHQVICPSKILMSPHSMSIWILCDQPTNCRPLTLKNFFVTYSSAFPRLLQVPKVLKRPQTSIHPLAWGWFFMETVQRQTWYIRKTLFYKRLAWRDNHMVASKLACSICMG